MPRHLTAGEAAEFLGVRRATLYAYVSRGLIRSEAGKDGIRGRRYRAEDVEKLASRRDARRDPESAVIGALHWGTPILDSALTLIADGHLYYRGQDATRLARDESIEGVASLLWTGERSDAVPLFLANDEGGRAESPPDLTPFEAFQAMLPVAARSDVAALDLRPAPIRAASARIVRLLFRLAGSGGVGEGGLAQGLAAAWRAPATLLSAAIILCADHELNVSAFTARCVASAGASPYNVTMGGLAALQGHRHGGHTERVEAFIREVDREGDVRRALASRLTRGEGVPGFGHPLYPDGDPRARYLLDAVREAGGESTEWAKAQEILRGVEDALGHYPSVDFALVVLARVLDLRRGAPLALFALGRSIGWLAHAQETYASGRMIRPRARYVGIPPAPL